MEVPSEPSPEAPAPLSGRDWLLILVLAMVNFTHIMDFMILMPLQPNLAETFHLTPQQFGNVVSVYGIAASIAGLLLASLLDRFDRKLSVLLLYAGFTAGTFCCALAPSYEWLVLARLVTGAFGGVVAAAILAIIGDAFPPQRRGTATGAVMSAFSVASIVGVPAGLFLAQNSSFNWRAPFLVLGALGAVVFVVALRVLPNLRGHITRAAAQEPSKLVQVLTRRSYWPAYLLMITMILTTFTIVPYIAAFVVNNVGRPKEQLFWIYLCGGLATLLSTNVVGRIADRFNRRTVFRVMAVLTAAPILTLGYLPAGTPLLLVLLTTTAMMVTTSSRMVPAMAMITGTASPRMRGSFLSVTTALQQMATGVAAQMAGFILGPTEGTEPLVGFSILTWIAALGNVSCVLLVGFLHPAPDDRAVSTGDDALPPARGPVLPLPAPVRDNVRACR